MNILYFSFVELDVPNACQTHTLGILRGFSNNACKVDALLPRPKKDKPSIQGVRFFYIWPWQFNSLGRLYVKIIGTIISFCLCLFNKFDAIYVREMEINPFPRWCSKIFHIPLYMEINSILTENMRMNGEKESRIALAAKHQCLDFKCASGLFVPSYTRCQWIVENYSIRHSKVHLVINGSEIPAVKKTSRSIVLRRLGLIENGFYLGFIGTIWKCYDLIGTLKAIALLKEAIPNIHLLMIGDGPEIETMKVVSKRLMIKARVLFIGHIQHESLYKIAGAIDVGLMNMTKKGLMFGGPVTSRFATYATFNIPVIANEEYIEYYPAALQAGLSLVPVQNIKALVDMILYLYHNELKKQKRAEILHEFVQNKLTWYEVTNNIIKIMKSKNLNKA